MNFIHRPKLIYHRVLKLTVPYECFWHDKGKPDWKLRISPVKFEKKNEISRKTN